MRIEIVEKAKEILNKSKTIQQYQTCTSHMCMCVELQSNFKETNRLLTWQCQKYQVSIDSWVFVITIYKSSTQW